MIGRNDRIFVFLFFSFFGDDPAFITFIAELWLERILTRVWEINACNVKRIKCEVAYVRSGLACIIWIL